MAVHVHAGTAELTEPVTVYTPATSFETMEAEGLAEIDTSPTVIPCTDWLDDEDERVELYLRLSDEEAEVITTLTADPQAPRFPVVPMTRPAPAPNAPVEFFAAGMLVATGAWSLVRALF